MSDEWREYWEKRSVRGKDYGWLGHGSVVKLPGRAQKWHDRRFMEAFRPRKSWILLDAGCGAGDEVIRYHRKVDRIIGVDFSLGMLMVCRERLERTGIENADFVVADARALPFRSTVFGGSVCMGVLQFMNSREAEQTVAELARVTKDRMLLHGKNSFSPFGLELRLAERLMARVRNRRPHDHHRPWPWYRKLFSRYGRVEKGFTIGLWIPQMSEWMKVLLGSLEVLGASLGLNNPLGKEYYVVAAKQRREERTIED